VFVNIVGTIDESTTEINALDAVVELLKTTKNSVIFTGDLNLQYKESYGPRAEREKAINDAISELGYKAVLLHRTMASLKVVHCNDTILVDPEVFLKRYHSSWVISPRFQYAKEVADHMIIRTADWERLIVPLFTDHYPVAACFVEKK
jgi:hypothetical protein